MMIDRYFYNEVPIFFWYNLDTIRFFYNEGRYEGY